MIYAVFCPKNLIGIVLLLQLTISNVQAWNVDEMEVFDAVDDIKQNFYTLLNVSQDADLNSIKKSFRKLSLILHPDKNASPNADQEFRHLMLAYEVLRNPGRRKYYDNILVNGLPDWRQAVYYYRRVRKIGLQEMCIMLAVIISIGQYLVAWAAYLEKKYTLQEILKSKDKKLLRKPKKLKVDTMLSDDYIEMAVPKPSIFNTLPFQICYALKATSIFLFKLLLTVLKHALSKEPEKDMKDPPPLRSEAPLRTNTEKPKKRNYVPELVTDPPEIVKTNLKQIPVIESVPVISGGLWTDEDILTLIRLVKKYPAGESERWDKIATAMHRTVSEVTHMANKIKGNDFRIPAEEDSVVDSESKKIKTKGGKRGEIEDEEDVQNSVWSQTQQKALEAALHKYSKKSTSDRWEKIASCVPDKTKDECILRYKKIAAVVKQRKLAEESEIQNQEF